MVALHVGKDAFHLTTFRFLRSYVVLPPDVYTCDWKWMVVPLRSVGTHVQFSQIPVHDVPACVSGAERSVVVALSKCPRLNGLLRLLLQNERDARGHNAPRWVWR